MNILSNFIPHETLTVDDKDPPLFTKKIKNSSTRKTMFIKAIEIAKTTITFTNWGDWKFYKNTYITQLSFQTKLLFPNKRIQKFIGHY